MWQDGKRTLIWWIRCATFQATCWNLEKCEYWHHRLSTTKHYICMTSTRTISICLLPYLLFVLPWTCKTFYDHCMSWTCGLLSRHQFCFRGVIFCKSLYTICRINQSSLFRFIVYFTSNLWCGATHYLNRMGKMCNAFDSLNMRNAHYFYTCLPVLTLTKSRMGNQEWTFQKHNQVTHKTQSEEKQTKTQNRKLNSTNPPLKPGCSFEFPLQCLFSCFVVLMNPNFYVIYLTFFLSLSIGFKNGLTFFDDSRNHIGRYYSHVLLHTGSFLSKKKTVQTLLLHYVGKTNIPKR